MSGAPTHGQIRAARALLQQTQGWLAEQTQLDVNAIRRLEAPSRRYLNALAIAKVRTAFETHGIAFQDPDDRLGHGIYWKQPSGKDWTAFLKAARAMLDVTLDDVAELTELGRTVVSRTENRAGKRIPEHPMLLIRGALESAGIVFIPETEGRGAGIRLRANLKFENE